MIFHIHIVEIHTQCAILACDGVMKDLKCGELKTVVTEYDCAKELIVKPNKSEECQIDCLKEMIAHVCVATIDYIMEYPCDCKYQQNICQQKYSKIHNFFLNKLKLSTPAKK